MNPYTVNVYTADASNNITNLNAPIVYRNSWLNPAIGDNIEFKGDNLHGIVTFKKWTATNGFDIVIKHQ